MGEGRSDRGQMTWRGARDEGEELVEMREREGIGIEMGMGIGIGDEGWVYEGEEAVGKRVCGERVTRR